MPSAPPASLNASIAGDSPPNSLPASQLPSRCASPLRAPPRPAAHFRGLANTTGRQPPTFLSARRTTTRSTTRSPRARRPTHFRRRSAPRAACRRCAHATTRPTPLPLAQDSGAVGGPSCRVPSTLLPDRPVNVAQELGALRNRAQDAQLRALRRRRVVAQLWPLIAQLGPLVCPCRLRGRHAAQRLVARAGLGRGCAQAPLRRDSLLEQPQTRPLARATVPRPLLFGPGHALRPHARHLRQGAHRARAAGADRVVAAARSRIRPAAASRHVQLHLWQRAAPRGCANAVALGPRGAPSARARCARRLPPRRAPPRCTCAARSRMPLRLLLDRPLSPRQHRRTVPAAPPAPPAARGSRRR